MMTEAVTGVILLQPTQCQGLRAPPEARRGAWHRLSFRASEKAPTLLTPSFCTSSLQNCETINMSVVLSHPVCGTSLRQPSHTNICTYTVLDVCNRPGVIVLCQPRGLKHLQKYKMVDKGMFLLPVPLPFLPTGLAPV